MESLDFYNSNQHQPVYRDDIIKHVIDSTVHTDAGIKQVSKEKIILCTYESNNMRRRIRCQTLTRSFMHFKQVDSFSLSVVARRVSASGVHNFAETLFT